VFVTGESGTGKEVCAEALHRMSNRSSGPFVVINCAAIPRDLLESEIFGHAKGAFTGAVTDRKGAALQANGGTLFLDEICEMDISLQSKLLRFLQDKQVRRLGEDAPRAADVRIVCATNRDPLTEVSAGRFREDLLYRLHVVPVELPPLRDREDDVLLIARHFLLRYAQEDGKSLSSFSHEAEMAMLAYHWPGNIRQLQNVIRSIVVLNDGACVTLDMLPLAIRAPGAGTPAVRQEAPAVIQPVAPRQPETIIKPLDVVIRETIEYAIARCGGSIPKAAAALTVSPSTLYRRIQSWETEAAGG
jgi:two-component system, repressor protein LuxO